MSTGFTFANLPGGCFDARSVDPTPSFVVPPMDDYIVIAVSVEPKENNDKTGGYLQYNLQIQQGKLSGAQYAKVMVIDRLNIFSSETSTVEMSYKALSAMAHATGRLQLQRPEDLLNIPFIATIGPQKKNPDYSQIYARKDMQGNVPTKQGAAAVANTQVPAAQPAPAAAWTPGPPVNAAPATQPPAQAWGPPQPAFTPAPVAPVAQTPWGAQPPAATAPQPVATQAPWSASAQPATPAAVPAWPPR